MKVESAIVLFFVAVVATCVSVPLGIWWSVESRIQGLPVSRLRLFDGGEVVGEWYGKEAGSSGSRVTLRLEDGSEITVSGTWVIDEVER